nr:SAV_915 family protein [Kibdelosporangium sp. MJ126-NF4]CEL23128.1 hypothetical protein [Kibdelosporangium sp. MJ126-NF4]CTQ90265.1 hypothetical protein [Kibdelosporangium sp. MJ126-NF4]
MDRNDDDLFSMDDLPRPVDPSSLGCEPPRPRFVEGSTFVAGQRRAADPDEVDVEIVPLSDGRTALFAYTSTERLVECLGPHQPWLEIKPVLSAARLQLKMGADVMVWDQAPPSDLRRSEDDR